MKLREKDKPKLLLMGLALVLVLYFASGYLSVFPMNATPDAYYDYSIAPITYNAETSNSFTVMMTEKAPYLISTAVPLVCTVDPGNGCGTGSVIHCTDNGVPVPGNGFCSMPTPPRSRSNVNMRSVRVLIDGQDLYNLYHYPSLVGSSPDSLYNYTLSSRIPVVGPVCCWGAADPCSVCYDINHNGFQYRQAYVLSSGILTAGNAYNGEVFTLHMPPLALSSGNHTLEVYMFAETLFEAGNGGNYGAPYYSALTYLSQINMWGSQDDQNVKYNTHLTTTFFVNSTLYGQIQNLTLTLEEQLLIIQQLQGSIQTQADYINSLNLTLTQQADLIAALTQNINQQTEYINALNATVQEKAMIIAQLTQDIQDQADMINQLNLNLQEKAALVAQLTAINDEQAALIAAMQLSFADQAAIIDALNMTIQEDALIIANLTGSIGNENVSLSNFTQILQYQAQIIANMNLTIAEEQALILQLTNYNQIAAQNVADLQAENATQLALIARLTGYVNDAKQQNDLMSMVIYGGVAALVIGAVWKRKELMRMVKR